MAAVAASLAPAAPAPDYTQAPVTATATTTLATAAGIAAAAATRTPFERHWSEYVVDDDTGEFPVGWEQRSTTSGIAYYVDHIGRRTTVGPGPV